MRAANCTCPQETAWQRAYRESYGVLCPACTAAKEQASREHQEKMLRVMHSAVARAKRTPAR